MILYLSPFPITLLPRINLTAIFLVSLCLLFSSVISRSKQEDLRKDSLEPFSKLTLELQSVPSKLPWAPRRELGALWSEHGSLCEFPSERAQRSCQCVLGGGGQRVVWTPCPFPSCGCRGLWLSWHPGAVQALSRDMAELAAAGLAFARHLCL